MSRFTATTPKALIEVCGRPFLRWKLEHLRANGISRVVISTGHLGEQIEREITAHCPPGMTVVCVADGPELLGTGGALGRLARLGHLDETFLLTFGDNYLTCDHQGVWSSFDPGRYDGLMTVWKITTDNEPRNAVVSDGRVTVYDKTLSSAEMLWVDYGLCVLTRRALLRHVPETGAVDLAGLLGSLASEGRLQALEVPDKYFEIGSESGLAELETMFRSRVTT